MYAEVLIEYSAKSIDKTFTYIIPENLISILKVGMKVIIPFGKKNKVNKDIGCGSNKLFRLPNNKEAKISKQYNAEINTLCKGVNCREAGVIELLKECEINYRNKFEIF